MVKETEKIRFVITADGKISLDILGIQGSSCDQIVKIFEELGIIQQNQPKKEYYEQSVPLSTGLQQKYSQP